MIELCGEGTGREEKDEEKRVKDGKRTLCLKTAKRQSGNQSPSWRLDFSVPLLPPRNVDYLLCCPVVSLLLCRDDGYQGPCSHGKRQDPAFVKGCMIDYTGIALTTKSPTHLPI